MDLHKGEALIMRSSSLTFSVRPTTTTNPATIEYDDKLHGWLIASDNDYRYVVFPMLFNYRLVVLGHESDWLYYFGWCYPQDLDLVCAAVGSWNPETQDEPEGWHKRILGRRRAPCRDEGDELNRDRCVHGQRDGCHVVDCPNWEGM